jgi:hypothetical protein
MKQFWPIILNELSRADMRRRHEVVAYLLERIPEALPSEKFFFSDECAIKLNSSSRNVIFWPNRILITQFIWKTNTISLDMERCHCHSCYRPILL